MTEPLSAHEEELLRAYNRTLADSYSRWKEEGENLPKTVARMLFQWRAAQSEAENSNEFCGINEDAPPAQPATAGPRAESDSGIAHELWGDTSGHGMDAMTPGTADGARPEGLSHSHIGSHIGSHDGSHSDSHRGSHKTAQNGVRNATPTASPTAAPTASPTAAPTAEPMAAQTAAPTGARTATPKGAHAASSKSFQTLAPADVQAGSPSGAQADQTQSGPMPADASADATQADAAQNHSATAKPTARKAKTAPLTLLERMMQGGLSGQSGQARHSGQAGQGRQEGQSEQAGQAEAGQGGDEFFAASPPASSQATGITNDSSPFAGAGHSAATLAPGLPGKSPILRESPRKAKAEKPSGAEQGQLPGISVPRTPGETAPMSNYLARTSLFAPIRKGRRVMHDKQKLHSPEGIEAFYTGKQLDMADQDVYLTALRLAGGIKAGDRILINRAAFLRMLGYKHNPGARDYKWLEESFYRIATGRVIIKAKHIEANLPLMGALLTDTRSGDYYFTIPRETYALWAKNLYSYIDLEKRHALERNVPLSKWLQSYAQSHAPGTHTISMDLLHLWCGYGGRLRDFRDSLTGALDELTRVGILASWSVQERGKGRQKKIMISWVRERTHRDDAPAPALNEEL